jgi:hypothetical protein
MAWGRVSSCHSRKTYRFFVNFYSSLHERSAQLMNLLRGFTLKDRNLRIPGEQITYLQIGSISSADGEAAPY